MNFGLWHEYSPYAKTGVYPVRGALPDYLARTIVPSSPPPAGTPVTYSEQGIGGL